MRTKEDAKEGSGPHHCPPPPTRLIEKIIAGLAGASLLILVFYTCFTYRIAISTDRAIRESGRAWLTFSGVHPRSKEEIAAGNPTSIRFDMLNSGHTPALKIKTRCQFVTLAPEAAVPGYKGTFSRRLPNDLIYKNGVLRFPLPLPKEFQMGQLTPIVSGIVGPNTPLTVTQDIPGDMPWELIGSRVATVYFMGETLYTDPFGKGHGTTFRLYLAASGEWSFADEGNDAY